MKEILLTQGKVTVLDDWDYDYLSQWKWCASKHRNTYYVIRRNPANGSSIKMHRVILGLRDGDGLITDHIDRNGLNNCRSNLRVCTSQQNQFNLRTKAKSSRFKGVHWSKRDKKWIASIRCFRRYWLGAFKNEILAARAYDKAAGRLHKEFANLNFP